MIPTLDTITAGLASGRVSTEQAGALVAQHILLAIAQGRTRDLHAAEAVEAKLLTQAVTAAPSQGATA